MVIKLRIAVVVVAMILSGCQLIFADPNGIGDCLADDPREECR